MRSRPEPCRAALLLALLAPGLLGGCAALVFGGATAGALAVHDRRELSSLVDDASIERITRTRLRRDGRFARSHVRPVAYNGRLLLIGEVDAEHLVEAAGQLAAGVPRVREVINELVVQPMTGPLTRSRDALLVAQVNTALQRIDDLPGFDATRVKVVSVRREVYLMGLVTEEEARRAIETARWVSGVERVAHAFEYIPAAH